MDPTCHGSFVAQHLLAPEYLDSLKRAPRSKKVFKKSCHPFLKFDERDLGSWIDGCARLESLWSEADCVSQPHDVVEDGAEKVSITPGWWP